MSFLSRLFGKSPADREAMRPLWHRVVEIAREPQWYAQYGVTDSVPGRFDMITLILSLVLLRMEREEPLIEPSVRLTEIFVEDMDGQLRESGVGDLVVGKRIGKLMSTLGGRMGAVRELSPRDEATLIPVLERNVTLNEGADTALMARQVLALCSQLDALSDEDILAARIER